jgi:hypothetical protein
VAVPTTKKKPPEFYSSDELLEWALSADIKPVAAKLLLVALVKHARRKIGQPDSLQCFPSQRLLQKYLGGCHRSHISAMLEVLVDDSLIERVAQRRTDSGDRFASNTYKLLYKRPGHSVYSKRHSEDRVYPERHSADSVYPGKRSVGKALTGVDRNKEAIEEQGNGRGTKRSRSAIKRVDREAGVGGTPPAERRKSPSRSHGSSPNGSQHRNEANGDSVYSGSHSEWSLGDLGEMGRAFLTQPRSA